MPRILVVEDEAILRKNIVDRLRAEGHELFDTASGESAEQLAALLAPDLILADLRLPGMDGMELLRRVRKTSPRALMVLMTAHGSRQTALDAVRDGAYDYLTKPVELRELVLLVARACSHARAIDRVQCAGRQQVADGSFDQFVGISAASRNLKKQVSIITTAALLAQENTPPILITGETGTGKTFVAKILHNEGPRKSAPCVVVHCGTLTVEQFQAEYLGRTGHVGNGPALSPAGEKGMLELAHGGTIFLDEVSALAPAIQDQLLSLLEDHSIQTGDGRFGRPINLQFIAASCRDLGELVEAGRFSAALYHRLRVLEVRLPPLRERLDDIPLLSRHFLVKQAARRGVPVPQISEEALSELANWDWPGNVRELSSVMERGLLRCGGRTIRTEDVLDLGQTKQTSSDNVGDRGLALQSGELGHRRHQCPAPEPKSLGGAPRLNDNEVLRLSIQIGKATLTDMTHEVVRAMLLHTGGDMAKTADLLGISLNEVMQYSESARSKC